MPVFTRRMTLKANYTVQYSAMSLSTTRLGTICGGLVNETHTGINNR